MKLTDAPSPRHGALRRALHLTLPLSLLLLMVSCNSSTPPANHDSPQPPTRLFTNDAERIVHQAIATGNLARLDSTAYTFRFRDKEYSYEKSHGQFRYQRFWTDTLTHHSIRDVLTNQGLTRYINETPETLTPKDSTAYASSVNSVIYFAFLPYALQDPGAQLHYLGRDTIQGQSLDEVAVTFNPDGGGKDFEDSFRYWFHPTSQQLLYLAYVEAGNKSPRFRQAYNERNAAGITVRDYRNYYPPGNTPTPITELSDMYNREELELLSIIELKDIRQGLK